MLKDLQSLSSRCLSIGVDYHILYVTAASIWFEIWGSWIQVNKISIFPGKLQKNFDFFRQICKKFRLFQAIFTKVSIFHAKIAHLQLLLGKLFYFLSKVTTFEHRPYFLYMIRYNNILRPVHNQHNPPCNPARAAPRPSDDYPAKNLGVANPQD